MRCDASTRRREEVAPGDADRRLSALESVIETPLEFDTPRQPARKRQRNTRYVALTALRAVNTTRRSLRARVLAAPEPQCSLWYLLKLVKKITLKFSQKSITNPSIYIIVYSEIFIYIYIVKA